VTLRAVSSLAVLTAGCALLGACSAPLDKGYDPDQAVSLEKGQIVVRQDSPFLKHLEVAPLGAERAQGEAFKVVGQVVALANNSDELTGSGILWSELDPALTQSLGLSLSAGADVAVGQAYGMVEVPASFAGQLSRGETVSVSRYGLRKFNTPARVASVRPSPDDEDWVRVVFRIPPGDEWYPGNNCEVAFSMLRSHPVTVPTTALLHEGSQEYLLRALGPGRYSPLRIVILDTLETGREALIIGDIPRGAQFVSRGAILLKPYLHGILRARAKAAALGSGR
jgi:hypothetical protein